MTKLDKLAIDSVLPSFLYLPWLEQSKEFQGKYDLETNDGKRAFMSWWINIGHNSYPATNDSYEDVYGNIFSNTRIEFIPELEIYVGQTIYNSFLKKIPTENQGNANLRSQYLIEVLTDANLEEFPLSEFVDLLACVIPAMPALSNCKNDEYASCLIALVWLSRPDLLSAFPLQDKNARVGIVDWWLNFGQSEYVNLIAAINLLMKIKIYFPWEIPDKCLLNITVSSLVFVKLAFNKRILPYSCSRSVFFQSIVGLIECEDIYLDQFFQRFYFECVGDTQKVEYIDLFCRNLVFYARNDLSSNYHTPHNVDYIKWWSDFGRIECCKLFSRLTELSGKALAKFDFVYRGKCVKFLAGQRMSGFLPVLASQVNLIGIPYANKGISEDWRAIKHVLENSNWEVNSVPFPMDFSLKDENGQFSYIPSFHGRINIFVHPPFATADFFSRYGFAVTKGRINIALWQWEFDSVSEKIVAIPDVFNDVWTISNFAAIAFRKTLNRDVYVVPELIEVKDPIGYDRIYFGLKEAVKYFLFVFDGESSIQRKNPLAVIKAFKEAFNSKCGNVGLVIKFHSLSKEMGFDELLNEAHGDDRIVFIDQSLSRNDLMGLVSICDVFISLHRCEGFGRLLAEAMLLGKPVIASRYSGNLDFMNDHNSLLVDGSVVEVPLGAYQGIDESNKYYWFDPDISHAAIMMRYCLENPIDISARSRLGQKTIRENYNLDKVISFMSTRISNYN